MRHRAATEECACPDARPNAGSPQRLSTGRALRRTQSDEDFAFEEVEPDDEALEPVFEELDESPFVPDDDSLVAAPGLLPDSLPESAPLAALSFAPPLHLSS